MQDFLVTLILNPYIIGAVVYAVASRYVVPPVALAIQADVVALWDKYFPAPAPVAVASK